MTTYTTSHHWPNQRNNTMHTHNTLADAIETLNEMTTEATDQTGTGSTTLQLDGATVASRGWHESDVTIASVLEALPAADAMLEASSLCPESERDQNWDTETTTYVFDDGSKLTVSGATATAI